ncbi:hypothetical protein D3C85_1674290 [compost metagenome]
MPAAPLLVATAVERRHLLGDELAGLLENCPRGVAIDLLGEGRDPRPLAGDVEYFVEQKIHVAQRW